MHWYVKNWYCKLTNMLPQSEGISSFKTYLRKLYFWLTTPRSTQEKIVLISNRVRRLKFFRQIFASRHHSSYSFDVPGSSCATMYHSFNEEKYRTNLLQERTEEGNDFQGFWKDYTIFDNICDINIAWESVKQFTL